MRLEEQHLNRALDVGLTSTGGVGVQFRLYVTRTLDARPVVNWAHGLEETGYSPCDVPIYSHQYCRKIIQLG